MLNIVFVFIVSIALSFSIGIGVFALFRSQSYKKNYFLLLQLVVIVYLFGHLMELVSTNAEEAYAAVKVLYAGGPFVPVFVFFFVSDYCNVKIPSFIKVFMVALSFTQAVTMWTTKFHGLFYINYRLETSYRNYLDFTPGILYGPMQAISSGIMFFTMGILLYQIKKWKSKYRKQLLIILTCLSIPFIFEGFYLLTSLLSANKYHLYFTPYSMSIMSICLYLGVMRFNIFEIISVATVTAIEHIREGFVLVDQDNKYLSSNPAAEKIIPGIKQLLKGESIFLAKDWPEKLEIPGAESLDFSISGSGINYYNASISPVYAKNRTVFARIILFREITDSVNLMKELENAAYLDSLTGIYNRKHFFELANVDMERAIRLNQSMFTAMLDLDFFKNINDSYGHAAGDQILKNTAAIIRQTIRSYDLLGRYGGEEFVLLISDIDSEEAMNLMERIRENMEHAVTGYEGAAIKVTCSIGLAKFRETDSLESSLKKADYALYAAKNSGRNKVKLYGEETSPVR